MAYLKSLPYYKKLKYRIPKDTLIPVLPVMRIVKNAHDQLVAIRRLSSRNYILYWVGEKKYITDEINPRARDRGTILFTGGKL